MSAEEQVEELVEDKVLEGGPTLIAPYQTSESGLGKEQLLELKEVLEGYPTGVVSMPVVASVMAAACNKLNTLTIKEAQDIQTCLDALAKYVEWHGKLHETFNARKG